MNEARRGCDNVTSQTLTEHKFKNTFFTNSKQVQSSPTHENIWSSEIEIQDFCVIITLL